VPCAARLRKRTPFQHLPAACSELGLLIKVRAQRKSHECPVSLSPTNRKRKMTKVVEGNYKGTNIGKKVLIAPPS